MKLSEDEQLYLTLVARESERRAALIDSDRNRLASLLADDLVHVHTTGQVNDKAQVLDHATGFLRFLDVIRGPLVVRAIGPGVAVMTGTLTNVVQRRGIEERIEVRAYLTQVWAKGKNEVWSLVSFHAVRLPDENSQEK